MWIFSWKWKMKTLSTYSSSRREEPAKDGAHVDEAGLFVLIFTSAAVQGWNGKGFGNLMFKLIFYFFFGSIFNHPKTSFPFLQCSPWTKLEVTVMLSHTHTFWSLLYACCIMCVCTSPIYFYIQGGKLCERGCLWLLSMVPEFL